MDRLLCDAVEKIMLMQERQRMVWTVSRLLLLLAWDSVARAHTCGYLRDVYRTAGGNTTTCCGRAGADVVVAHEVQRVVFSFPITKRGVLNLEYADHAATDGGVRYLVTILRRPGSVEQHISRVGAFILAQSIEQAYVPQVPQCISFDDFGVSDRERLTHAIGLSVSFFTTYELAFKE